MLFRIFSLIECIFKSSNKEMLAVCLFKLSIKLYSILGITFSFGVAALPVIGVDIDGEFPMRFGLYYWCYKDVVHCIYLQIHPLLMALVILKNS